MNTKYVLALVLTLHVSMSLCEIPDADAELVAKYDQLKTKFYTRLLRLAEKVRETVGPFIEGVSNSEQGQAARDYVEDIQSKSEFQLGVRIGTRLGEELQPLVAKIRKTALGIYGYYLRPYIGEYLNNAIEHAQPFLDQHLPTA